MRSANIEGKTVTAAWSSAEGGAPARGERKWKKFSPHKYVKVMWDGRGNDFVSKARGYRTVWPGHFNLGEIVEFGKFQHESLTVANQSPSEIVATLFTAGSYPAQ
jgi:hypothetical protein